MIPLALGFGPSEFGIIVVVVVVLFGVKRLPELGKSLAEGIHEFKKASKTIREDDSTIKEEKS